MIAVILVIFGLYLAFTKQLPFVGQGYQIKAVFQNAQEVAIKSPVRIAGVNVGEVTAVDSLPQSKAAVVTMTVTGDGRPVHTDARLQLRPRLFLEGNLFVDLHPGSPSAPEAPDGYRFPIQQTSNTVQLDQILTTLQSDVRGNLQILLQSLGDAFQKYGGANGLRLLYQSGGPAYKSSALVNAALLGTRAHDLSGLVTNFDRVAAALDTSRPDLQGVVTHLREVTGAFAAQDQALKAAVHELPAVLQAGIPALNNLNTAFPFVRAFAREALPGVRSSGPTLDVATPWVAQLNALVSRPELLGLTQDLRPTIPQLAKLNQRTIPFLKQGRALASCFNQVIIPWSNSAVQGSSAGAAGKVFQETGYGLTGIAGESRSGDANGLYIRVGAGGGNNTVVFGSGPGKTVGSTPFKILGSEPSLTDSAKTPFRPDVPCETQQPPNLATGGGAAPTQFKSPSGFASILQSPLQNTALGQISRQAAGIYQLYMEGQQAASTGNTSRAGVLFRSYLSELAAYIKQRQPQRFRQLEQRTTGFRSPNTHSSFFGGLGGL